MILFIDIEVASSFSNWERLLKENEVADETTQDWHERYEKLREKYWEKMNFMPEYNKILTLVVWVEVNWEIKTNILKWDEKKIIEDFFEIVWKTKNCKVCWFNIMWFDIPFLVKRAIHYKIRIPDFFRIYWKPKWELINFIDLKDVYSYWVFGAFWNLDLVCEHLWIKSPKDEWIDWSMVQEFYDEWKEEDIYKYCERDVKATIFLYKEFLNLNLIWE